MASNARKHIIIPEYKPLFAMRECYGPQHGPLIKPCATPIPVIGKLLRQSGRDQVTIYEVKVGAPTGPVRLTLENYQLPYEEILAGGKMSEPSTMEPAVPDNEPVAPTIVPPAPAPVKEPEPEKEATPEPDVKEPDKSEMPKDTAASAAITENPDKTVNSDTGAEPAAEVSAETAPSSRTFDDGSMIETIATGAASNGNTMTKAQKKAMKNAAMGRDNK